MTIEQILAALGLIGIGSVIPAIVSYFIASRKKKSDSKQELKEKRYKAILLLCYAFVNYEREHTTLIINRPNITSKEELLNELTAEWVNMSLYASDMVISKMKKLLEKQGEEEYNSLIIEMRKDLYSVKTKLTADTFKLEMTELINKHNS
ncbi:hypothetical protein [Flagellimonas pacifica]|uniref:Uncharacterized protein n=1 Tax=Flagellimonas pacifica TaxID=1247520 RepID=A0A285MXA8_9FLAO|nr:hypothetical protein [Allomuricauda parva]SNZ01815.1 hypothetical protein SAMN06265377_3662 [Allomuricauda parva]